MKYDQISEELWLCAKKQGFTHDFKTSGGLTFKDCMGIDEMIILEDIAGDMLK